MRVTALTILLSLSAAAAFVAPPRRVALRPTTARSAVESEEELAVYGAGGVVASLVVFVSEATLKATGCGLPAGPFGSVGAIEGISYLAACTGV